MSELHTSRAGSPDAAPRGLAGIVEQWAADQPRAPLVVYGEWRLAYRDVNAAANRLAHRLLALGVGPGVRVGLCLDRGPDLLVAILAVMKAGGAFVPLDPHWPADRLARMRDIAAPAVITARTGFLDCLGGAGGARLVDLDRDQALITAGSSANPAVAIGPADTCYVLFTSGSTGTPKGVPVTHGNLANLFPPLKAALDLGPGDTWTWYHSASFGFSMWELLGALLHGGCLVVVPEHIRQDPAALGDLVVDEGVTVFSQTPSAGRRLLQDERFHARVRGSRLRWFALSGEAVRRDDIAAWLRQGHAARLINTYAITETAGQLTLRVFGAGDDTEEGARNLGPPLPGREVLVLDEAGRPVADSTPGELWVGGDCVTPGYLGAPELAGRFPSLAVPGRGVLRGYLTGDRVRRLGDGALEYLGRVDAQLKFRGHRIEPGDIEAALRGHPAVRDAAVGLGTDGAGNQRLTAWVVGDGTAATGPAGKDAPEFWPSLGAYGIYDPWLYGLMNAEPVRLAAYRAAFAAAAPGKVVLDIGTGADAVLARLAVEAGAEHVYAVEVLPDAARRATDLVASLGLADRITVLEGDIAGLTLPRPVDVCAQGIIGNIGSADGIAPVWNAARRLFAPGCVPVPSRCVTRIAPLELPAATRADPRFGPVAADYARRVLASAGQPFDLRLCLRNVRAADLLGDAADFEVLDFQVELPVAHQGTAELTVTRAGLLDGCLLWTVVTAAPGATVDYFREQQAWLPVFIPLGDEPLAVRAGDRLRLEWSSAPDSDPLFPDYRLAVTGPDGVRREHVSRHRGATSGGTALHRALLATLAAPAAELSVTELRRWLDARLPEHLVPQSWVFLPELPLGPGGKLDRDALPAPGAARPRLAGPDVPPRTPAEAALAALWGEVLGIDRPGVEDDFFELGGDSIAAVQLTTRLQRWLDAGVPLAALFEQPTVAGLAGLLAERFGPALAAALERTGPATAAVLPAPSADGPRRVPLTFSQRSLAFLESLYPGDTSASEQFALRLTGPVDAARLGRAFAALCRRHPILTAAIDAAAGECVLRADGDPPFRTAEAGDDAGMLAIAEAELRTPFDLATGPLVRAVLCRTGGAAVLVVTAHHIGADGLSVPALVKDLAALHAGTPLPAAPAWADLAAQPAWQAGDTTGESLDWWRTQLAGLPPPVLGELVAPPPGARRSRRVAFALEPALADDLRRLARATGATPFMVLLAAFRTLLFRLTGREDLPIGTPMTLRDDAALDGLVGCLVNPVVLRAAVAGGQSFRELVQAEKTGALAALQRGRVPFAAVVEAVAPERRLGEHPLFQVLFSWEPAAPAVTTPDGVSFEPVSLPAARSSYFDLECGVRDAGEGGPLAGHLAWSTTVLEDWVAEQLPGLLATLVAGLVAGPDRPVGTAPLLPAALRAQVVTAWNATAAPLPAAATLHDMFLARAGHAPDGVAVRDGATVLTAGELADRSAALGAALLARGVAGRNVGVAIGRSADLVVAVLAVLRAGGTVVPLDPGFPAARLGFMARDAELALLLVACDGVVAPPAGTPVLDVARWRGEPQPAAPVAWPAVLADAPAMMLYTSGSTGEPKGALTTHAGAVNRVHWLGRREGLGPDAGEVFALRTSLNFIDAWWEIFGALAHGVPLQVVPDDVATDPVRLPGFLAATGVTRLVLVPSLLAALLEQLAATGARLPALRGCITSGEPLPPALIAEARRLLPGLAILNTYGTSEIWDATACDVGPLPVDAVRVPIGRPIANTRVYVTDDAGAPLPPGIPGELRVAGPGVGPGYWRRPALTAEKFVVMALPDGATERVYRTGDRARFLADGTVEVLGRLDAQFKLRGQRIEPAEIEQALARHPGVAAAVVGLAGEGDAVALAAGIVPAAGWSPPAGGPGPVLGAHLAALLPAWMVPTAWVLLDTLPLTPTGKRDRRAGLAAAIAARPAPAAGEAPLTGTEQRLAALWGAVLGGAAVGRDDDFFHRGGHSLLAARLLARVRATFGVEPGLRALFAAPTLAGFAAAIDAAAAVSSGTPPVPATGDTSLPSTGDAPVLSHGQERLWFLEQLDPGNPAYNVAWTIRCDGPLDRDALAAALSALVARHAALRTRFPAGAGRPAVVVGPALPVLLDDHDLRAADDPEAELARRLRALARQPFDLARGPLCRAALLRTGDEQHHLLLVIQHIVTDATSNHVLFGELADLLAGRPLPAPAAGYLDFARRQRAGADTPARQADLAWWRRQLAGAPAALELPTDRPRPAEQRFAGAWLRRPVPATLAASLERFARERGCTPFMVLLAAFKAVLHRYSGAVDVLVGTPVEGRPDVDVERTVGLFINTLVLRTDLAGDPDFATLLGRVRATTLDAQARQQAPFEQLVEALAPERSLARNPVFQVMFNRIEVPEPVRRAGDLELRLDQLVDPGISSFDLTLTAASAGGRLGLTFEYATALFDAATVEELADAYLALLAAAVADPAVPVSRLPLLAPDRREARLGQGRGAAAAPDLPVPDVVAAVARDRPAATAVTLGATSHSYGELDDRAARLAGHLVARGIRRGDLVGVCLPRAPDYLVAVLGALKAGAAYVPLDPDYPPERLAALAADAGLAALVVNGATRGLPGPALRVDLDADAATLDATPPAARVAIGPDDLAYVLYTSGSTGRPKGVRVTHGSLANALAGWRSDYGLVPGETHLQMAGAAFDVFTGDWVRALGTGGRLLICPRDVLLDPPALLDLLRTGRVAVAEFVPAVMRLLVAHVAATGGRLPPLRLFIVGSDTWHGSELAALRAVAAPGTRIINSYGVAEATIDSTWFEAGEEPVAGALPVGRPFPGVRAYVLDGHGEPLPLGVPGELCLGGLGVAAGYLGDAALTARKFGPDPHAGEPGARLFRTGDRARWNARGQLELLGRADAQFKLRGLRIEPAEVEAALVALPGIAAAAVAIAGRGDDARLVAFLVAGEGDADAWRAALRRVLPAHLVPAAFVVLPALPLTPNGKVDRAALAALPVPAEPLPDLAGAPPVEGLEATLCALYAELLGVPAVAPGTDFFRAGGHSLLATRLVARLRTLLGAPVPLRSIFEAPAPRELAAALAALEPAPADVPAEPVARPRVPGVPLPLSPVQQRLWFLEQLEPGGATWHLHWLLRLRGPLDRAVLAAAFTAVVARHEALRTVFTADAGVPAQLVVPPPTVAIEVHAGPASPTGWLAAFIARPFDLRRGPLLRVGLVADGPGEHRLLVVIHHLVADGWSFANLARDLGAAYAGAVAGRTPALAPLPLQYADYALWQAEALRSGRLAAELDWWREALRGAPPLLDLGGGDVATGSRGAAAGSPGEWTTRTVSPAVLAAVKTLAAEEGATPFMLLQAAFAAVLGRLGATSDVVVGTPVAARPSRALEELVGFFVNTLVLRTDLAGEPTFRQLLRRVRRGTLEAFDHADVPFEKLVEALRPARSPAHTPLVQVLFALHNQPRVPLALPGLEVAVETVANDTVKFDLNLHAAEEEGGLHLALAWRSGLYGAAAMENLLDHYTDLLARVASRPDATLAELLAGVSVPPRRERLSVGLAAAVAAPDAATPTATPTATEAGLLDLWGDLLGAPVPGPDADFFALGGHSLLATRVIAGIAARFGVELPLLAVFEAPTVRGLAARVDARRAAGATGVAPIRRLPRQPDPGDPP